MDPNIKPIINPLALEQGLKLELKQMTQLDIIVSINEPTDWVSSLVMVEKLNGSLRVYLDPRNLNKTIKREYHCLPIVTDIFQEMAGAQ